MFRKTVWRRSVTDVIHRHQDRALITTIFILREFGPVGFLLQEEEEAKHYKVCLGDPHTCTCSTFQKERDLCTHICWILMRKFRLPRDHEYCFQFGLAERQILELLQGLHVTKTTSHNNKSCSLRSCSEPGGVRQKDIQNDDICPICQEELLLKKLPVTYCRFSCGNNIHITCMKVWADHQMKLNPRDVLKCPLCRDDFGPFNQLSEQVKNAGELCTYYERDCLDKHLGVVCNSCRVCPVIGKCFKCTECSYFHLCENCFKRSVHPHHSFMSRTKRSQSWQTVSEETQNINNHTLDRSCVSGVMCDVIPNHVMKSLPMMRVRKESKLLFPGAQCRMCLSRFQTGQNVRSLPCKHKFHTDCIDPLIQTCNSCPLDGHVIYNPLTWNVRVGRSEISSAPPAVVQSKHTDQHISEFVLSGMALHVQKVKAPSPLRSGPRVTVKSLAQGVQDLCIQSSHIEVFSRKPAMKPVKERRGEETSYSTFTRRCSDRDERRLAPETTACVRTKAKEDRKNF